MPLVHPTRLLPLLALSGCALMTLATQKKAWPDHGATVTVLGPTQPVRIVRDDLGIPHIQGQTEGDAVFAMGFVHAQDRLFQADMARRAATGQLSELIGERAVDLDGFMQGLELSDKAKQSVARSTFMQQALLESYAAGFNAGIEAFGEDLPVEYQLLGVEEVLPWKAEDALATAFLQSWNLAENPRHELGALGLGHLPGEQLDDLLAMHPKMGPLDAHWDDIRLVDRGDWTVGFRAFTSTFGALPEASQASNNWIVGPALSADEMPIVANDPHLGQSVPSLWHAVDVAWPDGQVTGVTLPGSPLVVIGHNQHVAWGLTNVMADYVDLAIVEREGEDHVIIAGEKKALKRVETKVRVKDGDTVKSEALWTDLGPVISELEGTHLVVLQWHALTMEDEIVKGWFGLNHATTVAEAIEAMDRPMMVAQNLVVADVHGDWAWQSVGAVPKRKKHSGRVPYPASDPEHGWDGWLDELPGERQPERGWLATANYVPQPTSRAQDLDEEGNLVPIEREEDDPGIDPWTISTAFTNGWRDGRVRQLLGGQDSWTPEQVHQMQLDIHDRSAEVLLPLLMHGVKPSTTAARKCKQILDDWDMQVTVDSPAPAVWNQLKVEVLREALVDDIGEEAFQIYLKTHSASRNILPARLDRFQENAAEEVDRALTAACQRMESNHGEDMAGWAWGAIHPLRLNHPFAESSSLLSKWNMPEVPFPGSGSTVAAASGGWHEGEKPVGGMASVRFVMPTSDLSKSTMVYPGGQSGLPRHPDAQSHYQAFVEGKTLPLYSSAEDIAAHTASVQTLVPQGMVPSDVPSTPAPEPEPEVVEGEAVDGEAVDSEAVDGEPADGEAAEGEAVEGEAVEGEAVEGEATPGGAEEAAETAPAQGPVTEGDAPADQAAEAAPVDTEAETPAPVEAPAPQ